MAGIYIHIPFCKQACHYCDFHFSTSLKHKNSLLNSLLSEIEIQKNYLNATEEINTIYFGGGTPSMLSQKELMKIFDSINKHFSIKKDAEVTLEANPDDLTSKKIKEFKNTPINRLSIGIQSFRNEDLKLMNRAHNAQEAHKVVGHAQDNGFENISIDLIYGLPSLSNLSWKQNLQTAFHLKVNHISAYCLTVEDKTALAHMVKEGIIDNVDEQKSAEQFEMMLAEMNLHHFEQYEISNFCKDKQYSKHNSNYWLKQNYLGIGPSAHSFNGSSRQWNLSNNNLYIKKIARYLSETGNPKDWFEQETLSISQQFNEYLLTSLRTIWGTDLNYILATWGGDYQAHIHKEAEKYLERKDLYNENNVLFLTNKGKLIADKIASDLFFMD